MRKYTILMILLAGIFWLVPQAVSGQENDSGHISGRVMNATTGEPVADLKIELRVFENNAITEQLNAISDHEGNFVFTGLDRQPGKGYAVFTVYQGVDYYGRIRVFDPAVKEIKEEMTVYDPTDSDEQISITRHHVIVQLAGNRLVIQEVIVLKNSGNTVYAGSQEIQDGKKGTFRATLPAGAKDLQLGEGLTEYYVFRTEDGFVDRRAIEPGEKQIGFRYELDESHLRKSISRTIQADTTSFDVFVPVTGILVESQDLTPSGNVGETGHQFLRFSAGSLKKGENMTFTLQRDQAAVAPTTEPVIEPVSAPKNSALLKNIPFIIMFFISIGFLYSLWRSWKQAQTSSPPQKDQEGEEDAEQEQEEEDEPEKGSDVSLEAERHQLLVAVVELDEQFAAKQIAAKQYTRRRQKLLDKAVRITRRLREQENA